MSDPLEDGSDLHPFDAIQEAIDASYDGNTVIVRDGRYSGPGNVNVSFLGKAITVQSLNGPAACTIDCGGAATAAVARAFMFIGGESRYAVLSGFTITGGYAEIGGGILCSGSSPVIRGNCISGCSARYGGGIYCNGGSPLIDGNTISSCSAVSSGGGLYAFSSSVAMTDNTITNNTTTGDGGGVGLSECFWLEITRCSITSNNSTHNGGGAYFRKCRGMTFSDSTISHNASTDGAGVYLYDDRYPVLSGNTIVGNEATGTGGGIGGDSNGYLTVEGSHISGNSAAFGGGIYIYSMSLLAANNLVEGNVATEEGGGIRACDSAQILGNRITGNRAKTGGGVMYGSLIANTIVDGNTATSAGGGGCDGSVWHNDTIVGNTAGSGSGGGLAFYHRTSVASCIIWGNSASDSPQVMATKGQMFKISYSSIQGGRAGISCPDNYNFTWGPGNADADPLFADASTPDYHLKSQGGRWDPSANGGQGDWVIDGVHSPCIDAGDPAADYSLEPVPNGGCINMGAYGNTAQASRSVRVVCTLTVRAAGASSVAIEGTPSGTTPYIVQLGDKTDVALTAPAKAGSLHFRRWKDSSGNTIRFGRTLTLSVIADTDVTAEYTANGDQWYVDDNAAGDPGPGNPLVSDPLEDGSQAHPFDAIQEAVDAASEGHTVSVAGGTYTGAGNRDVEFRGASITVVSATGAAGCIIDCQASPSTPYRAFYLHSGEDGAVIDGFTIKRSNGSSGKQGAIACDKASPTIRNCTFTENSSYGIYSTDCSPAIIDNVFNEAGGSISCVRSSAVISGNTITGKTAGSSPIYLNYGSQPVVVGNTITGNATPGYGGRGGAVSCKYVSSVTITDNVLTGNSAEDEGGALCLDDCSSIVVANNVISDNTADQGGAIYTNGYPSIVGNVLTGNRALHQGGAVYNLYGGPITISDNVIEGNKGSSGGGIALFYCSAPITNNLIAGNNATTGGGVYVEKAAYIANNTFADNSAGAGGGLFCLPMEQCLVENCIFYGNTATTGSQITAGIPASNATFTVRYCDIQGGQGGMDLKVGVFLQWGEGNVDADPMFIRRGGWASGTWTRGDYRLLPASPCIDAGDPAYRPAHGDTDCGGRPRLAGVAVDLGAYEHQDALFVDDDAPADPGPGSTVTSDPAEDGSEAHPFDAIQEAVDAAHDGDTILVLDGTYTGSGNVSVSFRGKAVTVRSLGGPGTCVVDGGGSARGFYFGTGETNSSVLEGFTIRNGSTAGSGGAIYCTGASPVIRSNVLTGNSASSGGAIGCANDAAPLIIGNTISGNSAASLAGGIYCNAAPARISGNVISGNTAARGAGIYCRVKAATISHNTITGNTATGGGSPCGGGIYCESTAAAISDNVISDNEAGMQGGGIFCGQASSPALDRNVITANHAPSGGGIACTADVSPAISNTLIAGNTGSNGSGIWAAASARPVIRGCTIADNTASASGGGLMVTSASATVSSSILWGNAAPAGPQVRVSLPVAVSISYCDLAGGPGAVSVQNGTVAWGAGNIDADPLLGASFRLPAGSPCIDAGDPAYAPPAGELDLLGWPRLAGAAVDMGAVEHVDPRELLVDDDGPGDPAPGDPAESDPLENGRPDHPFDAIQEAIDAAEPGDVVVVLDGTYTGTGNLNIDLLGKEITVRSKNGPAGCVIDCQGGGRLSRRAFVATSGETNQTVIHGLTITNAFGNNYGGAFYCEKASPSIIGNVFVGNKGDVCGGAIYATLPPSNLLIAGNTFTANSSNHGGAIALWDGAIATIVDNVITENAAVAYNGGGICCGEATITGNVITGNSSKSRGGAIACGGAVIAGNSILENSASSGGAICSYEARTGTLLIAGNSISGNTSYYSGGIYVFSIPSTVVTGNTITLNTATQRSAGIGVSNTSATISGNTIANNQVSGSQYRGGGIACESCTFSITNNVIAANSNAGSGGGIGIQGSTGDITGNTIFANTAATGGGIVVTSSIVKIANCILWGNSAGNGPQIAATYSSTTFVRYSAVQGGAEAAHVEPGCTLLWQEGNLTSDPIMDASHHLTESSPCIDAGDPDYVALNGETDIDGDPRVRHGRVDIGADEYFGTLTLTVASTAAGQPHISGVAITGDRPGTTPYSEILQRGQTVCLTAPLEWMIGARICKLVHWTINGIAQPQAEHPESACITMDDDVAATVAYEPAPAQLIIEGPVQRGEAPLPTGTGTMRIDVYARGVVGFGAIQSILAFYGPQGATAGAFAIAADPDNAAFGGQAIACNTDLFPSIFPVYVDDPTRLHYREAFGFVLTAGNLDLADKTRLLSVTCDYTVSSRDEGTFTIAANRLHTLLAGAGGSIPFEVVPGSAAFAPGTLPGDTNGDCMVNILDLVAVRDLLGHDASGDARKADVNNDGRIDIRDLIFVRNRLFTVCPPPEPRECGPSVLLSDVSVDRVSTVITAMPLDLGDMPQDRITLSLNGVVKLATFPLGVAYVPLALDPGRNCLAITAVSGGSNGTADVLVIVGYTSSGEQVQGVSIPVGMSAMCTITK